jgi:hypothetical protein
VSAAKRVRWTCPNGCPGILSSTRPPKDSVDRYCLTCSAKTGRLVLRIAPALESKRAAAATSAAAKAKAKRAREAAKKAAAKQAETDRYTVEGVDLRDEFQRLIKLRAFGGKQGRLFRRPPEFVVTRRSRPPGRLGYAEPWNNRISIATFPRQSLASAQETLIHELTHIVVGRHGTEGWHGVTFRLLLAKAFKEGYKVRAKGIHQNRYHGRYAAALQAKEGDGS